MEKMNVLSILQVNFLRTSCSSKDEFDKHEVGKSSGEIARPIKVIMSSIRDKQILLGKKQLLRGSRFFLDEDLTIRQQEERREEMSKVRAARDEGKRAWLFKGKVVIAFFSTQSKT